MKSKLHKLHNLLMFLVFLVPHGLQGLLKSIQYVLLQVEFRQKYTTYGPLRCSEFIEGTKPKEVFSGAGSIRKEDPMAYVSS